VAQADGEVIITNDGATILNKMRVEQPAAKMLVELAKSQDVVAGDGTTSVTVLCGALLKKSLELLEKGVHPTVISDAFGRAAEKAVEVRRLDSGLQRGRLLAGAASAAPRPSPWGGQQPCALVRHFRCNPAAQKPPPPPPPFSWAPAPASTAVCIPHTACGSFSCARRC
jgi:hypothetical protein